MSIPEVKRYVLISESGTKEMLLQKTFSELINAGGIIDAEINYEDTPILSFGDYLRMKGRMLERHRTNSFVDFRIAFCDPDTERELIFELLNGNPYTVLEVWHNRLENSRRQYRTMSEVFDYIRGTVEKEFMLKRTNANRPKNK